MAPADRHNPRSPDQGGKDSMATTSVPSGRRVRTTRHHRVDYEFLGLLNEDFGIDYYSLNKAFMGVPPAPKRQAIYLCEWAIKAGKGDVEEAGQALRAWAKKHGTGLYNRRIVEGPALTHEQTE